MRPFFQDYFTPTRRGRRRSTGNQIDSINDPRITWLNAYPSALFALRKNPLAWAMQLGVREFFVWACDMISDCWQRSPDYFPKFCNCWPLVWSNKEILGAKDTKDCSFNHGIPIDLESPPPQNFYDPENFLLRLLRLIRSGPVITIDSLHQNGFSIHQMSDFCQLYEIAFDLYQQRLKPRRILWCADADKNAHNQSYKGDSYTHLTNQFYWPLSTQSELFETPIHFSDEDKLNFVKMALMENHKEDWQINFDRLCVYGVLEYSDMRFYELITGTIITEKVKIALVNRSREATIRLGEKDVYKQMGIKDELKDLRTTRKLVQEILDLFSVSKKLDDLNAKAIHYLVKQWKMSRGKGDNLYALSAAEVKSWQWD